MRPRIRSTFSDEKKPSMAGLSQAARSSSTVSVTALIKVGRDVDPVGLADVPGDLAHAHAVGIHRDDLLVEAREPPRYFAISAGSKVPARSRGLSSSNLPVPVVTVLRP